MHNIIIINIATTFTDVSGIICRNVVQGNEQIFPGSKAITIMKITKTSQHE